jgi:hypothetical protein
VNIKISTIKFSLIFLTWIVVSTVACSFSDNLPSTQSTLTPTSGEPGSIINPTSTPSICSGLSGEFEVMVLVGPAEAVGLEPFSVGTIPFSVVTGEVPYIVEGSGQLVYQDMLVKEWGSYSVDLLMETTLTGECVDSDPSGRLDLTMEMTGEQMVEVLSEGFTGEYPWTGTYTSQFSLQVIDGISTGGEGWEFILHLPMN